MNKGIRRKLLLSFLAVAFVSLLTIQLLVYWGMSYSFTGYLAQQRQSEAQSLAQDLTASYQQGEGWPSATLMEITHRALSQQMILRIYDVRQRLQWDSSAMMRTIPTQGTNPSLTGGVAGEKLIFPLSKGGHPLGTLEVEFIADPYAVQEEQFLARFNTFTWIALLLVLLGIFFFSRIIAASISNPLVRMKEAAVRMQQGDLAERVDVGGDDEIAELGKALNHLAQTLQEQEKFRKNLTADIAHELRTPLATVQSYLEAFQDGIWTPTADKLRVCYEQVMQLIYLIHDLEHLADAENPMLQLKRQSLDLVQLLHEAVHSQERKIKEKQLRFHWHESEGHSVKIHGDPRRLLQVFANLLNNACKYTPPQGEIFLRVKEEEKGVAVELRDTGPGIPQEDLPYIFERFYRGEKSRNRKTGGAGIGLAIVKAIVEAHGGRVTVRSQVGQGTQFVVWLPK